MATHIGNPSATYYAKPVLETAPATWGSDVIEPTTVENSPHRFEFAFTAGTEYLVYEQAGASPASTDEAVAQWPPTDSSGITTLLSRILGTLAAGTHQPQTGDSFAKWGDESGASIVEAIDAIEGGGSGLTGDYTLTVTVTDADTDEAIEAATVTLFRTGERGVEETDDEGEATFGVNAATWSWVVRAAGYQSATGTKVISGNDTLDVELTAIVEPVLDNPDHASLRVKCLDEANQPEPGAVVYIQIVGIPAGSTGLSFDGISQEATAGSDGIATLTIVKLAKYQIRRGDSKQWKPFTATSDNSQTITSFIGVDPA